MHSNSGPNGLQAKGLKNILRISHLRLPQTCVWSKCLIMQTLANSSWAISELNYCWRSWKGKSQVATQTFNLLYYFPIIYYNMSYYCYELLFFSDTCLPCFFLSLFIYDRTDIYHKANMPFTYAYLTFTLRFTCVRLMANTFLLPI